MVEGSGG
jgi:hypothetical protein